MCVFVGSIRAEVDVVWFVLSVASGVVVVVDLALVVGVDALVETCVADDVIVVDFVLLAR